MSDQQKASSSAATPPPRLIAGHTRLDQAARKILAWTTSIGDIDPGKLAAARKDLIDQCAVRALDEFPKEGRADLLRRVFRASMLVTKEEGTLDQEISIFLYEQCDRNVEELNRILSIKPGWSARDCPFCGNPDCKNVMVANEKAWAELLRQGSSLMDDIMGGGGISFFGGGRLPSGLEDVLKAIGQGRPGMGSRSPFAGSSIFDRNGS